MTEEKPDSMQETQSSKLSPWSRWRVIGMFFPLPSSFAYSTAPCAMYWRRVWLAYLRAPEDTWRMTGEADSVQAWMIACICSMLLKLYAGMA